MSVTRTGSARRHGFTLIEILVVLLIMAILMAIAMPLYLAAVADSQRKTCRANMQTIGNAEQAYRTANPAHAYTTTLTDLNPYLGAAPICPRAGTYSVAIDTPAVGQIRISCSAAGHGSYVPGIDNE